jgi:indole-3-glycerol phosphate synthase
MSSAVTLDDLVENAFHLIEQGYYNACPRRASRRRSSFEGALASHPNFPIIAEVKLSTPVDGAISSAPPSDLVMSYINGGAAALSVLTEPTRFAGDLRHLLVCETTEMPVLMKDFIVDERQVRAASRFRTDAVLLIQEVFSDRPELDRDGLIDLAHFLGLEVVLEAHSEPDMRLAMESEADLLGINQRDLRTMRVDRGTGLRMLPLATGSGRPVIVMSGISEREEVARLRSAGASAVLVGKGLSSLPDPAAALRALEVER